MADAKLSGRTNGETLTLRLGGCLAGLVLGAGTGAALAILERPLVLSPHDHDFGPYLKELSLGIALAGAVAGTVVRRRPLVGAIAGVLLLGLVQPLLDLFGFYPHDGWLFLSACFGCISGIVGGSLAGVAVQTFMRMFSDATRASTVSGLLSSLRSPRFWLGLVLALDAYLLLTAPRRPDARNEDPHPTGSWRSNRFGQEGAILAVNGLAVLATIYATKYFLRGRTRRQGAVQWYCVAVSLVLPGVWFGVDPRWNNEHVFDNGFLIGGPVGLLLVPSVTFWLDQRRPSPLPTGRWWARSALEVFLLIPFWWAVWEYASFFLV